MIEVAHIPTREPYKAIKSLHDLLRQDEISARDVSNSLQDILFSEIGVSVAEAECGQIHRGYSQNIFVGCEMLDGGGYKLMIFDQSGYTDFPTPIIYSARNDIFVVKNNGREVTHVREDFDPPSQAYKVVNVGPSEYKQMIFELVRAFELPQFTHPSQPEVPYFLQ